jgi:HD-GYP domain-containing protein (c-di-GMP phosphodiesterase class II)
LGKTWIANDILLKTDDLTEEEMKTMERHPLIGGRIIIGMDIHPFYVETVLYHHERWNGQGYPAGLDGEDIPLSARIVTVVDIYDILTAQSTPNFLLSKDEVHERLLMISGSLLDPLLVRAFRQLIDASPDFNLPNRINRLPNHTRHHLAVHHSPFPIGI